METTTAPLIGKTESHSTEAERTVLGALLLDPDAIFKVDARLQPTDFYDPVHAAVYEGIHQLSQKGSAVDFVTVSNKLQSDDRVQSLGGVAFLSQLATDIPTSSHIEHYADSQRKEKDAASKLLPRVHRVTSLLKRWLLGTHR